MRNQKFEQLLTFFFSILIKRPTEKIPVYLAPLSGCVLVFVCFSHEDGTVRFWDASGVSLKPLYKLNTANIFQTDCDHNDSLTQAGEEEWPPFRKVRDLWEI